MKKEKILFCWSGGKDSAMALYEILQAGSYDVVALLTTLSAPYDRISMHGVRRSLLDEQVRRLGIPPANWRGKLEVVSVSTSSNEEYEKKMGQLLSRYKVQGVETVAFGDIFLEDLRKYREDKLASIGMKGLFPLWKRDTMDLAHSFIDRGFKAVLTCVNPKVLDPSFAGRSFDRDLLRDLPGGVDPCGENGEFHSFVFGGPLFKEEIPIQIGERVRRESAGHSFWYCDILPKGDRFL